MFKFFRKFRKKFISNNQTSRYLKYAIGEILLVVIGILIAVQINAFVSQNKLERDNKVFLNKMISELELNKKRMRFLALDGSSSFPSLKEALQNCDTILKLSYVGFHKKDLPLLLKPRLDAGGSFLNLHTSIYEELLNTGKLYSLASDNLITDIKNYYKRLEREDLYNKANTENASEYYDFTRHNLYELTMDYSLDPSFSLKNYPWYFNKKSKQYKNMQKGIALMYQGQSNNYRKMLQIIKYSDSLIVSIKKELDD